MATRTRTQTTEEPPKEQETPGYQVPPPMEEGDERTVPPVGEDVPTEDAQSEEDTTPEDAPFGFVREVSDGWEHTEDGGVRPTDIPWAGY